MFGFHLPVVIQKQDKAVIKKNNLKIFSGYFLAVVYVSHNAFITQDLHISLFCFSSHSNIQRSQVCYHPCYIMLKYIMLVAA